jgi:GntR family transcriptional regulator/MocR family aminotransferase
VRAAYEKLSSAQLIVASRASGTHVADRPVATLRQDLASDLGSFMEMYQELIAGPSIFQMGVPASATFPAKLFARMRAQAVRAEMSAPPLYPDPRGELSLRREIAAYLALARGIECTPSQIIVTAGFSGGLGLALSALGLAGKQVWMEEPGFPFTRHGLELAGLSIEPIPIDAEGIDVDLGIRRAPHAALAVVTPGQQAPLGSTLSLARRSRLLDWAAEHKAWIIEDDYLSELQLKGRATPALASLDCVGRVIHIGSFSKTLAPALRLGFVVAPTALAVRFAEVAACLAPAPGPALQLATAAFMREGHYLRHLRRTKRLYAAQGEALLRCLRPRAKSVTIAGLAAILRLPEGVSDVAIAREAAAFGLAPTPLSIWYASPALAQSGLLLGVATAPQKSVEACCTQLLGLIEPTATTKYG